MPAYLIRWTERPPPRTNIEIGVVSRDGEVVVVVFHDGIEQTTKDGVFVTKT